METKTIDAKMVPMIIYIPENAVKLQIIASLLDEDDSIIKAESKYDIGMIREGLIEGQYWEDENVKYVLNEDMLNKE